MKLNKEDKNLLRMQIENKLYELPSGHKKIKIDKDLLEDLLFEIVTLNEEDKKIVKIPIWSGSFLKYIDLSDVDFTNVSWSLLFGNDFGVFYEGSKVLIDSKGSNKIRKIKATYKRPFIDYAYTNANIDLSKSFEAINLNKIEIRNCIFVGLDLSNNDLSDIYVMKVFNSNIRNTNIQIPDPIHVALYGLNSDFDNIDLSGRSINAYGYLLGFPDSLSKCSLVNTGLNVNILPEQFVDKASREQLRNMFNNNYLKGCLFNGRRLLSRDDILKKAENLLNEYNDYKTDLFDSTIKNIDNQIKLSKK